MPASPDEDSPLGARLRDLIRLEGPIGVDRYMAICLGDPQHGYYTTRDPFGAAGDFVTAPEISQMFGELIGLWAAEVWLQMGSPAPVVMVELGPGRGTLMADALRAARALPAFRQALSVHLVETSPVLRQAQGRALADADPTWHDATGTLPDGPIIVIANEFLDALPIRQFVRKDGAWRERLVGLDPDGRLAFGLAPDPEPLAGAAPEGTVREVPVAALPIVRDIARRIAATGGAALFIDYGHDGAGYGDTLQALRAHGFADPLARPGSQDLTVHVDFAILREAARAEACAYQGTVSQGEWLLRLGLGQRAAALSARADPGQAARIAAAFDRLTAGGATAMGRLFKVGAIANPALPLLPGFDTFAPPDSPAPVEQAP